MPHPNYNLTTVHRTMQTRYNSDKIRNGRVEVCKFSAISSNTSRFVATKPIERPNAYTQYVYPQIPTYCQLVFRIYFSAVARVESMLCIQKVHGRIDSHHLDFVVCRIWLLNQNGCYAYYFNLDRPITGLRILFSSFIPTYLQCWLKRINERIQNLQARHANAMVMASTMSKFSNYNKI